MDQENIFDEEDEFEGQVIPIPPPEVSKDEGIERMLDKAVDEGANLEDAFQDLFKSSVSGTGEEELLRIASKFSIQLNAAQMRALVYLDWISQHPKMSEARKKQLKTFIANYLEYKQYNGSDMFVMRALDSISLRKFIGENAFKIDIQK